MAHGEQPEGARAHSYLDLGAALDALFEGAGHEFTGGCPVGPRARWCRVAVVLAVGAGVVAGCRNGSGGARRALRRG